MKPIRAPASPAEKKAQKKARRADRRAAQRAAAAEAASRGKAAAQEASTSKEQPLGRLGAWWSGWRASTKRAQVRAEPARTAPSGGVLAVDVDALDVAAAADGPLRGLADPLLLLGVYAVDPVSITPVLRGVVRFRLPRAAPCRATPDVPHLVTTTMRYAPRALVVAALWEENSGVDARRLAAALEHPAQLHFMNFAGATPEVLTAREAMADPGLTTLAPRGILIEHHETQHDVANSASDTWVGGAVVVIDAAQWRKNQHRVALTSADRKQEWTLSFTTKRK